MGLIKKLLADIKEHPVWWALVVIASAAMVYGSWYISGVCY